MLNADGEIIQDPARRCQDIQSNRRNRARRADFVGGVDRLSPCHAIIVIAKRETLAVSARAGRVGRHDAVARKQTGVAAKVGRYIMRGVPGGDRTGERSAGDLPANRVPFERISIASQSVVINDGAAGDPRGKNDVCHGSDGGKEDLVWLNEGVADNRHSNRQVGHAGREGQRAGHADVIHTRPGGAVARNVTDLNGLVEGA